MTLWLMLRVIFPGTGRESGLASAVCFHRLWRCAVHICCSLIQSPLYKQYSSSLEDETEASNSHSKQGLRCSLPSHHRGQIPGFFTFSNKKKMFYGGFPVGRANDRPWDTMRSLTL